MYGPAEPFNYDRAYKPRRPVVLRSTPGRSSAANFRPRGGAKRPRCRQAECMKPTVPAWANWCADPALEPWTVGLEEEVMLLEPDGSPAWRSEDVLRELPPALAEHTRGETHGLALELATNPHRTVAAAASELRFMRAGLNGCVRELGMRAAVAGTHPL